MEEKVELCLPTVKYSEDFFRRATSWYFGGYLKMDTNRAPDPVDLITFLHVLGFRSSGEELSSTRNSLEKNGYQIEITCGNPVVRVRMEYPDIKSPAANADLHDNGGNYAVSSYISAKEKIAKEVFTMLMEFLKEKDEGIGRKREMLEHRRWRRCMSMSAMGTPGPLFYLPLNKPDKFNNRQKSFRENNVEKVVLDSNRDCINNWVGKQEEEMEVDMPSLNNCSLPIPNLSPIGLARQKTWVRETSKSGEQELLKPNTSTPSKSHQTAKIGLKPPHGLSKILRPRQARTEVQPQRLKSANTESLRTMTQMKDAKHLSSRNPNTSKSSSVSSSSPRSSYTSLNTSAGNPCKTTSSRLLAPPIRNDSTTGGVKPKLQSHSGVNYQSPLTSSLRRTTSITRRSTRLVTLPQVRDSDKKIETHTSQKKDEPVRMKSLGNRGELSGNEENRSVRKIPSLLPRYRSAQKDLPPGKG
ncbi:uncharacterized protein LOC124157342 isoform X2 [Ischnura elegans]|uniref:uncharacterized protein LOC124157342 isoform X2 n=1 Tax=Ischnura elegans TaxID=197161 RepID=UPI001ED87C54|nr:uncharacterized protein LOC124157342 isoform X2 [Ischnura elegans]